MNWHPSEDDLVLRYYGEAPGDVERRVDDHLRVCPACAAAWQELNETLGLVSTARVPEPAAGFEQTMWARIQREVSTTKTPGVLGDLGLERKPGVLEDRGHDKTPGVLGDLGLERKPGVLEDRGHPVSYLAIAAALVLVAGGSYWLGRHQSGATDAGAAAVVATAETARPLSSGARERVLLSALNDHFSQAEVLLTEFVNQPEVVSGASDFERESADDLVSSGRLYRQTARQNGDGRLADMLDDLESVLVEIARRPDTPNQHDFDLLRARIEDDALLFKVRAVSTEIRARQSALVTQQ